MPKSKPLGSGLMILGLLVSLVLVVQVSTGTWGVRGRESKLRHGLVEFREALDRYHADHGFFPCAPEDYNRNADPDVLALQLTGFTDASGEPGTVRSDRHRFGPYLDAIPAEAITSSRLIVINTQTRRLIPALAEAVEEGTGRGGWYYEARSGNVVANLGAGFPAAYARF